MFLEITERFDSNTNRFITVNRRANFSGNRLRSRSIPNWFNLTHLMRFELMYICCSVAFRARALKTRYSEHKPQTNWFHFNFFLFFLFLPDLRPFFFLSLTKTEFWIHAHIESVYCVANHKRSYFFFSLLNKMIFTLFFLFLVICRANVIYYAIHRMTGSWISRLKEQKEKFVKTMRLLICATIVYDFGNSIPHSWVQTMK